MQVKIETSNGGKQENEYGEMYPWSFILGVAGLAGLFLDFQKAMPQALSLAEIPMVIAAAVMGIAVNRKPYQKGIKGVLGLIGLATGIGGMCSLVHCSYCAYGSFKILNMKLNKFFLGSLKK